MKRLIYIVFGVVTTSAVVAMVASAWIWPVLTVVETGRTAQYPDIQPHYYSTDPDRIFEEVRASLGAMERWEIVDENRSTHRVEARRRAWTGGHDDVDIQIEAVTEFVAQVHLRSESATGMAPTDFGRNARNIEAFFDDLDRRLGAVKFEPQTDDPDPEMPGNGESSAGEAAADVGEG